MATQILEPSTPEYAVAVSPGGHQPRLLAEERSLRPTWVVYACVVGGMLQAFHYGWSNAQVNYSGFNNTAQCNARPVQDGTCVMFPGHTKTTWTFLVNAWIVGGMLGSLTSGFLSNKLGRLQTLRWNTVLMVVGAVVQVVAPSSAWFIVGRFVAGAANGIAMAVVSVYFNEISTPHNRHSLGINQQLAATTGILGVSTAFFYWGTSTGFRWIAAMPILMAVGCLLLAFTVMVESPVWLVTKGRDTEAEKELARLYGKDNVAALMSWIQANECRSKLPSVVNGDVAETASDSVWIVLSSPRFRRQTLIAFGLTCVNQLVGVNAVFFYSSLILADAGISDSRVGLVIIAALVVVPVPIASIASKRLAKRSMLLWGISVMIVCCVGITLTLVYKVGWLSIVLLSFFVMGYGMSIGPLLWPMIGELFPDSARGNAVGLCVVLKWICALIVGIGFPYLEAAISNYTFTPFLGTCVLSLVFIYFMVPETSDLTIAEIQDGFHGQHSAEASGKSQH